MSGFRIIRLIERRARVCRLRRIDVDYLLAHHRPHVDVEFMAGRHLYRVTPRGFAGVILTPNYRLILQSKIDLPDLLFLLDPDDEISIRPGFAGDLSAHLLDLFAAQLARLMAERSAAGLKRGYAEQAEAAAFLKGQLDLPAQMRAAGAARREHLHCRFDELTTDILPNRLVKTTAARVVNSPLLAEHLRRELQHALAGFAEVALGPTAPESFNHALSDPFTADYRPLLELCQLLCHAVAPNGLAGQRTAPFFLLDLERLFERYVARNLPQFFAGSPYRVEVQPRVLLHEPIPLRPELRLRPDIVLRQDDRAIAVVDSKWKRLRNGPEPADLHQILAYAAALNCPHVVLAYPGRRSRSWTYALSAAPLRLTMQTICVSGNRQCCRAVLQGFALSLRAGKLSADEN